MPRQARIDFPGAFQHVIGRGIEKKSIFSSDKLKQKFYDRFRSLLNRYDTTCYAWSIMDNHFHFLLRTGRTPLATVIKCLLTGYAVYYNKLHNRSGHLFQNRYKAILCEEDVYFRPLVRYIHLNPVKANMIKISELSRYPWTGHREIVSEREDGIIDYKEVLSLFGANRTKAQEAYLEWIKEGRKREEDFDGGGYRSLSNEYGGPTDPDNIVTDERILGDSEFVISILDAIEGQEEQKPKCSLNDILKYVCRRYKVEREELLRQRNQKVREARSLGIYLCREILREKVKDLATMFGITAGGISQAYHRGYLIDKEEQVLDKLNN